MSKLTLVKPELNKPDLTEDPKIVNALTTIETWANGQIDSTNLKPEGVETVAIKLLAITAALIAEGTITEAKLSAALVTKLAEKGTGLVLTNKYSAEAEVPKATAEAGVVPSATRPAAVILTGVVEAKALGQFTAYVGGVKVGTTKTEGVVFDSFLTLTLPIVGPGEAWSVVFNGIASLKASTRLL